MKAIAGMLLTCAALVCAPGAAPSRPVEGQSRTSQWFVLDPGKASRSFTMRQPRGVVLVTRLTVAHGIRASVRATIPRVAGVGVSTAECRRRGRFDVCTQSQEWCPMPRATWRVRVVKTGGPAGLVRFDFVVGEPRRQ